MSESCHNNLPMRDNSSYRVNNSIEHGPPQLQPVQQANSDGQLIELWLHGRSQHTQRAYQKDISDFLEFVGTPISPSSISNCVTCIAEMAAVKHFSHSVW